MPRFFIAKEQITLENDVKNIHILGEDAHHIARALRMAQGEKIEVCDSSKTVYTCTLEKFIEDKEVIARVDSEKMSDTEPSIEIILYFCFCGRYRTGTALQPWQRLPALSKAIIPSVVSHTQSKPESSMTL